MYKGKAKNPGGQVMHSCYTCHSAVFAWALTTYTRENVQTTSGPTMLDEGTSSKPQIMESAKLAEVDSFGQAAALGLASQIEIGTVEWIFSTQGTQMQMQRRSATSWEMYFSMQCHQDWPVRLWCPKYRLSSAELQNFRCKAQRHRHSWGILGDRWRAGPEPLASCRIGSI